MANICPKGKRLSPDLTFVSKTAQGKRKVWVFLCCFVLTLLLVTTVVPALAKFPTTTRLAQVTISSNSEQTQGEVADQVSITIEQVLQKGRQLYEEGQFFEAAILWKQAAQAYEQRGATLNQAQALNYLSLAYQELGEWEQAKVAIAKSLSLLQGLAQQEPRGIAIFAQALNNRGRLQLVRGETKEALETWKQAEGTYDRAHNETGKLGSRINQAQALQALGQYRRAKALLEQLVAELQTQPDSLLKAKGLQSLGIVLQTIGDLQQSKKILEQSWAISKKLDASADTSVILLGIGNIARDLQKYDVALVYYEEAQKKAHNPTTKVRIQLNQLSLLVATKQWNSARYLMSQIESNLSNLPISRASVYARVNFAETLMKMGTVAAGLGTNSKGQPISLRQNLPGQKSKSQFPIPNSQNIAQILATAVQQARQLGDPRAEAYSLYELGKLYEQTQQWDDAKHLTEQALQIAQKIDAADIIARCAWQLGRILKPQGNTTGAIAAYQIAFDHLQSLRSDLVAINSDVQFTFKESVEPVYRELVSLLLQPSQTHSSPGGVNQSNLKQAREVIEALQLAELDDFFKDACLDTQPVQIDQIDVQAAVIYPIILPERLEVILSLPHQPLRHYATQLPSSEIDAILQKLNSSLYPGYSSNERLQLSEQVYNWLIRPAEAELKSSKITTIVFVLDGFLRNLPMSVLYDGQQYLVEKYSIALSPGLQLFPQGLERRKLSALVVGLTESRQGFTALPGVEMEVKQIASDVDSQVLLNQEFTRTSFERQIDGKPFPVVHLATHGQFSSNPEKTFLLTWDTKLNIKDFDLVFQKRRLGLLNPIELLVLSACQTASGDKRATLGLAGLALRSGARSTIASLWSVNDQSTSNLMSEFYRQLTQSERPTTKAEALRQAQLTLLKNPLYKHPFFWSAFVLVGNWL